MKIRTKLIVLYLLGASLTTVMAAFAIRSNRIVESDFKLVAEDSTKKIAALKQVERAGLNIVAITNEYALFIDDSFDAEKPVSTTTAATSLTPKTVQPENTLLNDAARKKELIDDGLKKYYSAYNQYENLIRDSNSQNDENLESLRNSGNLLIERSTALIQSKSDQLAAAMLANKQEQLRDSKAQFLSTVDESFQHQYGELAERQRNVEDTIRQSTQNTLLISAMSFVFAILGGALFSRTVTQPLAKLRHATQLVGSGELDTEVVLDSKDEVGELAQDFKKMTSQLRDAREELIAGKSFTENVISSMADMLVAVDDDGTIRSVNDAFINQLGYQEREVIGKPIAMITKVPTFFTEVEFEKMMVDRVLTGTEKDIFRKNGRKLRCEISASILKDHTEAAVVVIKDITQRLEDERRLREYSLRLEQSNRELQDFAYVASHDLQEPLRKVQAFGDRLNRKYGEKLGEEGTDYIRRMRDASGRMQTLINDLLTFSRVTTKAQPFEPIDLKTIAAEVVSDLEVRIEETHGIIELGELPNLDADPVQLRQLMQNLIGNALKFHKPETSPVIKVYSNSTVHYNTGSFSFNGEELQTQGVGEKYCQIVVQDNGIGFDEKYLDRIFTVFQRLHGRTEYEGSGVGLAVCRKIVERHGGTITAESRIGEGSKFLISLPYSQQSKETNQNATRL